VSEAAALGADPGGGYPLGDFLAARNAAVRVEHDPTSVADGIALLTSSEGKTSEPARDRRATVIVLGGGRGVMADPTPQLMKS